MYTNEHLLRRLQRRVAGLAINGASMRNQGAPGVVASGRRFLANLPIGRLVERCDAESYRLVLDSVTRELRVALPEGAQNWGTARKGVNIFIRDLLYTTDLANHHVLHRIRDWLEIPLDSQVAKCLKKDPLGSLLPKWPGAKHLEPKESDHYQEVALGIANRDGIARVDLDLWYWRAAGL